MTGADDFDESALNTQLGVGDSVAVADDISNEVSLNPADRSAIEQIAARTPTGVTAPAATAAHTVPDYLSAHMPKPVTTAAPEATPAATADQTPPDYAKLFQERTGVAPAEGVTLSEDNFEHEVIRQDAYNAYLNSYETLPAYRALIASDENNLQIVQSAVKTALEANGLKAKANFDNEMSELLNADGTLNEAGLQRAREEKEQIANAIKGVEAKAKEQGDLAEQHYVAYQQQLDTDEKEFALMGIKLPEDAMARLKNNIRTGAVDEWLNTSTDTKQGVQRAYRLALLADDQAFAEFVRLIDERGQRYGANKRLGASVN